MRFKVSYDPGCRAVLLEYWGALDSELLSHGCVAGSAVALEHDCDRFLINTSKATKTITNWEVYRFAQDLEDLGFPLGSRLALVHSDIATDHEFFRDSAVRRGFSARTFSEEEDALEWLGCSGTEWMEQHQPVVSGDAAIERVRARLRLLEREVGLFEGLLQGVEERHSVVPRWWIVSAPVPQPDGTNGGC